ncbi:MAG: tRNA (adenosine(37)-N6)-dimethylallyltransferase MiaA [Brevinema sp.]
MNRVLSVIGATASGKTSLAIQLAQHLNGEIVSCDSVQIYKYFTIGSAKPSVQELQSIPHYLIDTLDPLTECNAGLWRQYAIHHVNDIIQRGKLPIIVGGTGLYLKSVYLGMFEENSRDQKYRECLQNYDSAYLYQQLQAVDSVYAKKISTQDRLRIIRALEAFHVTGIKFSELHQYNIKPQWDWIFIKPSAVREQIYQNIEQRVYQMLVQGLIEETEALLSKFGKTVAPIGAIGYRHCVAYLEGMYDKNTMIQQLIQDTRRFAKRQESLFRSLIPQELLYNSEILLKEGLNHA